MAGQRPALGFRQRRRGGPGHAELARRGQRHGQHRPAGAAQPRRRPRGVALSAHRHSPAHPRLPAQRHRCGQGAERGVCGQGPARRLPLRRPGQGWLVWRHLRGERADRGRRAQLRAAQPVAAGADRQRRYGARQRAVAGTHPGQRPAAHHLAQPRSAQRLGAGVWRAAQRGQWQPAQFQPRRAEHQRQGAGARQRCAALPARQPGQPATRRRVRPRPGAGADGAGHRPQATARRHGGRHRQGAGHTARRGRAVEPRSAPVQPGPRHGRFHPRRLPCGAQGPGCAGRRGSAQRRPASGRAAAVARQRRLQQRWAARRPAAVDADAGQSVAGPVHLYPAHHPAASQRQSVRSRAAQQPRGAHAGTAQQSGGGRHQPAAAAGQACGCARVAALHPQPAARWPEWRPPQYGADRSGRHRPRPLRAGRSAARGSGLWRVGRRFSRAQRRTGDRPAGRVAATQLRRAGQCATAAARSRHLGSRNQTPAARHLGADPRGVSREQ